MLEAKTIPAKYVFLDVVSFTLNRSVEAQTDVVNSLNEIVKSTLADYEISKERLIYLPTGDRICIALLNIEEPYDIHLLIAKNIIKRLFEHNEYTENEMRRFDVRIGINANIDNLVIDINGNNNLAGAGINTAARVMSKADCNQILVSESVYDILRYREKYMTAFQAFNTKVKHGIEMKVYQYKDKDCLGLNTEDPTEFRAVE